MNFLKITSSMSLYKETMQLNREKSAISLYRRRLESKQFELNNIKQIKDKKKQLQAVSREMESLMLKLMFKNMKKNVPKSDLLHGGYAEEIFDDMLTDEYAKTTAHSQSLGLAKLIYDQNTKYL